MSLQAIGSSAQPIARKFLLFVVCTQAHWIEPVLQPLIVCTVAGFVCVNYTSGRTLFLEIEDRVAPGVHVAFFTLTGAAMSLDEVVPNTIIALTIALGRVVGIAIGAYLGGRAAGEPEDHNRVAWMAYITQVGRAHLGPLFHAQFVAHSVRRLALIRGCRNALCVGGGSAGVSKESAFGI